MSVLQRPQFENRRDVREDVLTDDSFTLKANISTDGRTMLIPESSVTFRQLYTASVLANDTGVILDDLLCGVQ